MNQNQITVTRGDDRTLTMTFAGQDFTDATASFTVDGLFTRAGSVDATPAVPPEGETPGTDATSTVTVAVADTDTEDASDTRVAYRYELQVTESDGDVITVRRGLFVVVPDLEAVS